VAVTNSQSNSSSHGLFTPLLETALYLLERAHAFALEKALARDGIHRRCGETVLNLQPVPHHALEQFALLFRHKKNLPFLSSTDKAQLKAANNSHCDWRKRGWARWRPKGRAWARVVSTGCWAEPRDARPSRAGRVFSSRHAGSASLNGVEATKRRFPPDLGCFGGTARCPEMPRLTPV